MALKQLSLATLQHIQNGAIMHAFDEEIAKVMEDMGNRPNEKKPRVINLQISMVPIPDGASLDSAKVGFRVSSSVPKRNSNEFVLIPKGDSLMFSDNIADARQRTLDKMFNEPGLPEELQPENPDRQA